MRQVMLDFRVLLMQLANQISEVGRVMLGGPMRGVAEWGLLPPDLENSARILPEVRWAEPATSVALGEPGFV